VPGGSIPDSEILEVPGDDAASDDSEIIELKDDDVVR
jgi:hypothetical protein